MRVPMVGADHMGRGIAASRLERAHRLDWLGFLDIALQEPLATGFVLMPTQG